MRLNHMIVKLPIENIVRKESTDGDIVVSMEGDVIILHSAAGFYFLRRNSENIEETLAMEICKKREYLCTTFEINSSDPTIVDTIVQRIYDNHGRKYFQMIDFISLSYKGRDVLLVKFPSCVVRQFMAPTGGVLKTGFSGPTPALQKIPTLEKYGRLSDEVPYTSSVFVTSYNNGQMDSARQLHCSLIQEVVNRPNLGITLNPVLVWDA